MANILTAGLAYDPYFYAAAALMQLNKRLGMAAFVHRDLESEKGQERGSTIRLRRPGKFVAQDMPIAEGSASDISPDYMDLVLDQWKGTLFGLTDKELSYTKERVINEHIDPAAIAVADAIDASLQDLALDVPWIVDDDATTPINDFSNMRERLFLNLAPRSGDYFYQLDNVLQKRYEQEEVFYQANTGVDAATLQRDGFLGRKFGFVMFANQNEPAYETSTITLTSPVATGVQAKGSTSLIIGGSSGSGDATKGTVITITGDPQKYAITADVSVGSTGFTAAISPPLAQATAGAEVIAFDEDAATSIGLGFHRQAFALAMAPLSTAGNGLGIRMATMADPITGLVLRTRLWASGGSAKVFVGIDALWGRRTLDPNLAVRLQI
jgi:hypothetical protein